MKLLIITAIQEDLQAISHILQEAKVPVFSVTETVGHKSEHHDYLPDNWFGKNEDGTDALVFFSFTEEAQALRVLELIKQKNASSQSGFPARAFMMPVEQFAF